MGARGHPEVLTGDGHRCAAVDDGAVAKALDLTATVTLSLPTDRLRRAE